MTDHTTEPDARAGAVHDPTTESIEAANTARDRLRAEVLRLSTALVASYTEVQAATAERDLLRVEVDRLKQIGDTMFIEGYDQAVEEIRDHFAKQKQIEVVAEIEKIWLQDKLSVGCAAGLSVGCEVGLS